MKPFISIIIPCYNQENYMDRCFQSVISQTYKDWECLIVDDGSTDKTAEIGNSWEAKDTRFRYLHKKNGGLSSARNFGMENAIGDYIFFIDSDDCLTDCHSLQHLVSAADVNTEVIAANINIEDQQGKLKKSTLSKGIDATKVFRGEEVLRAYLEDKIAAVAWNKLYKTSFLHKWGFQFIEGLLHEDELWSLQLYLKANEVISIAEYTYNYNKGNQNSITAKKSVKNFDSLIYIMGQISHYAATNEKLKSCEPKLAIRLFEKQYYFLKGDQLIADKKLWIMKYKEVQKIYKNSSLYSLQKRFIYPAEIAYFALYNIRKLKENSSIKRKILSKLISF